MVFNLINFFAGFLASSVIDTSLGEFSEWAVVGASLVVANIESFNNGSNFRSWFYVKTKSSKSKISTSQVS